MAIIPPRPVVRSSYWHPSRAIYVPGNSANGNTYNTAMRLEGAYAAIQLMFSNTSGGLITGIDKAIIAPSSAANDLITPLNAAGSPDNTLWIPVTFNNGGQRIQGTYTQIAPATGQLSYQGIPPALVYSGSVGYRESFIYSDPIALNSLTPTDGSLPWLFIRGYCALRTALTGNSTTQTNWATDNMGRTAVCYSKAGDGVTTPSGFASGSALATVIGPHAGVNVLYQNRGLSIATVGDSTYAGSGSLSTMGNAGFIAACNLSTPTFPVSHFNAAVSGTRSISFYPNAYQLIDSSPPDVLIIPAFTPNDPATSVSNDASYASMMSLAHYCKDKGVIPIITTPIPWGYSGGTQTLFLALVNRIRATSPQDAYVADRYGAVVDPNNAANTLAAYISGTSPPHLGTAGETAIATLAYQPILQRIMSGIYQ